MALPSAENFQHWVLWLDGASVAKRTSSRVSAAASLFAGEPVCRVLAAADPWLSEVDVSEQARVDHLPPMKAGAEETNSLLEIIVTSAFKSKENTVVDDARTRVRASSFGRWHACLMASCCDSHHDGMTCIGLTVDFLSSRRNVGLDHSFILQFSQLFDFDRIVDVRGQLQTRQSLQ
jgi:hypothetical protein